MKFVFLSIVFEKNNGIRTGNEEEKKEKTKKKKHKKKKNQNNQGKEYKIYMQGRGVGGIHLKALE